MMHYMQQGGGMPPPQVWQPGPPSPQHVAMMGGGMMPLGASQMLPSMMSGAPAGSMDGNQHSLAPNTMLAASVQPGHL